MATTFLVAPPSYENTMTDNLDTVAMIQVESKTSPRDSTNQAGGAYGGAKVMNTAGTAGAPASVSAKKSRKNRKNKTQLLQQ